MTIWSTAAAAPSSSSRGVAKRSNARIATAACTESAIATRMRSATNRLLPFLGILCLLSRDAGAEPPAAQLDTVTVTGLKREQIFKERINDYVSSVMVRSHTESLARWQGPICPYVTGAAPDQNEYIRSQIIQVAKDAGAIPATPDCATNLVVVLSADPEQLLRDWWSREHRLFSKDRGVRGAERFIQEGEAIRAWYNTCSVSPEWVKSGANKNTLPCNTGSLGTRLSWEAVRSIYSVIVVVDLARIESLKVGQVADYVAMIGLAQVKRGPQLEKLPTILRLFAAADTARPRELSSWDKTFLRSLYGTQSENVRQFSQILSDMGQALGGGGPDPTAAQARILVEVNRITPHSGRLISYTVTGDYEEGPAGSRSALINFEAELEFIAETYFRGERKAGDRVSLYGEVEYGDEGDGWRVLRLGVYPR